MRCVKEVLMVVGDNDLFSRYPLPLSQILDEQACSLYIFHRFTSNGNNISTSLQMRFSSSPFGTSTKTNKTVRLNTSVDTKHCSVIETVNFVIVLP
jgi:hypothetical protein